MLDVVKCIYNNWQTFCGKLLIGLWSFRYSRSKIIIRPRIHFKLRPFKMDWPQFDFIKATEFIFKLEWPIFFFSHNIVCKSQEYIHHMVDVGGNIIIIRVMDYSVLFLFFRNFVRFFFLKVCEKCFIVDKIKCYSSKGNVLHYAPHIYFANGWLMRYKLSGFRVWKNVLYV